MFLRTLLLGLISAAVVSSAQSQGLTRGKDAHLPLLVTETKHLKISASASSTSAAPGAGMSLFIDIAPRPKMHVYAPDQKDYIPVALALASDAAYKGAAPQFPKAETYFFAPLKETQRVYSKPFRIVQPVTLAPTAKGAVTIKGTLRYQACDDAICYMPQNVPVSWTINVTK
jgi:hypothetical protein